MPDPRFPSVCVLIRLWLPDRPGSLGLVASRVGALRGDIVSVVVLDQGGGVAVDELAVNLPDAGLIPMLLREIQEVDGTRVEDLEVLARVPDAGVDALGLAARLVEAGSRDELHRLLTEGACETFEARWAALVDENGVLAAGEVSPSTAVMADLAAGPWPLEGPGEALGGDVAQAPLVGHWATLLVARPGRRFYRREQLQLLFLARVADGAWRLLEREERADLAASQHC
jgi:hypothetical protein